MEVAIASVATIVVAYLGYKTATTAKAVDTTSKAVDQIHVMVNSQRQELLDRVIQLEEALTEKGILIPKSPEIL